MRTLILTLLLVLVSCTVFSQLFKKEGKPAVTPNGLSDSGWLSPNIFKPSKYKPKSLVKDTLIPRNLHRGYSFDEVKLIQQKAQTYIGNNGNGSDIYEDQRDNMMVLKPDKSFSSNMPNAINQVLLTDTLSIPSGQLPRIYRTPKDITTKPRQ